MTLCAQLTSSSCALLPPLTPPLPPHPLPQPPLPTKPHCARQDFDESEARKRRAKFVAPRRPFNPDNYSEEDREKWGIDSKCAILNPKP